MLLLELIFEGLLAALDVIGFHELGKRREVLRRRRRDRRS